jgi:hypothetical protein
MTIWKEVIAPGEEARFNGYAAELRAMQQERAKTRPPERALHVKPHVGAVGSLQVPELPADLRVGPFASPSSWPLYARFSNGTYARQHDGVPDVRGLALKLVGVPGRKVIPGLEEKKTQDFLFIQVPATPVKDPDEFMTLVRLTRKGRALLPVRLIGAFGFGRAFAIIKAFTSMPKVTSLATATFYTAVPIRFGESAAKLSLAPVSSAEMPVQSGKDSLRAELISRLKAAPVVYSLRAQLFIDEETTPIEDASVVWPEAKSPFRELGQVTLPAQDPGSARGQEIETLVERLSFDPWHSVEALRPLGSTMRARAAAYRESVIGRKAADEPESVLSL